MHALRISLLIFVAVVVTVALMMYLPFIGPGDAEIVRAGLIVSVTRVPLALATLLFTLRAMDWITHEKFADWLGIMRTQPLAAGIYHAARIVAVCLLLAALYR